MKKIIVFLYLIALPVISCSQNVFVNYDIDTSDINIYKPLQLWKSFLETKDDSLGSKYWCPKEVAGYGTGSYFLLEKELQFGRTNFLRFLGNYSKIKILSITKIDSLYKITSLMEFKEGDGISNLQYIFHVYAKESLGELKLCNPLPINTFLYLNSTRIGKVRYFYPKNQVFDYQGAKKQSDFLNEFSESMKANLDTVNFYYLNSIDEYLRIKGLDYCIGYSGAEIPSGKVYNFNTVLSYGLGAFYPHEVIHLVINSTYKNCHNWVNEGVATYFGLSRGKELKWHLKKVHDYLIKHPEVNLNEMLKLGNIDSYTNFKYSLGGLLVLLTFDKKGYPGVISLVEGGKSNQEFYDLWENELGVPQSELNSFIRDLLEKRFEK